MTKASDKTNVWRKALESDGGYCTTIAFTGKQTKQIASAIKKVEDMQLEGWVKTKGMNKGKTTVTMFIKAAVESACQSLEE